MRPNVTPRVSSCTAGPALAGAGQRCTARYLSADPAKEDADRLIAAGNRSEEGGDLRAACEHYRKAVEIAPNYADAHLNLGIGLAAAGESESAVQSYRAALSIDPGSAPANYNLATLLEEPAAEPSCGSVLPFRCIRRSRVNRAGRWEWSELGGSDRTSEIGLDLLQPLVCRWYTFAGEISPEVDFRPDRRAMHQNPESA